MNVRFPDTGSRNFHELGLGAHVFNAGAPAVAHGSTNATHKLVDDGQDTAFVGNPPFDAFRNELVGVVGGILEVAIGRAIGHGAKAAHAAIGLVGTTLVEHHFAGGFFGAGEHAAHHAGGRSGRQRLGDVAREANATVGDQGNPGDDRKSV